MVVPTRETCMAVAVDRIGGRVSKAGGTARWCVLAARKVQRWAQTYTVGGADRRSATEGGADRRNATAGSTATETKTSTRRRPLVDLHLAEAAVAKEVAAASTAISTVNNSTTRPRLVTSVDTEGRVVLWVQEVRVVWG